MIYDAFTSDLHFYHRNINKFCDRPYSSLDEMHEGLIKEYNNKIGHKDKVLFHGDIAFSSDAKCREILSQMNGKKHLVIGNHDSNHFSMINRGFELVVDKMYFKLEDRKCVASHFDHWEMRSPHDDRYPELRHQLNQNEMVVLLHGHSHSPQRKLLNQIHVGVDAWNMGPAMMEDVLKILRTIPKDWNNSLRQDLEDLMLYKHNIIHNASVEWNRVPEEERKDFSYYIKEQIDSKQYNEYTLNNFNQFKKLGWEKPIKKRNI